MTLLHKSAAILCVISHGLCLAAEPPHYNGHDKSDDLRIVGLHCNKAKQSLKVSYFTAYNLANEPAELWNTFDLKRNKSDSDYVESIRVVTRNCILGKNKYVVKIRGVPGNWNLNGRCGGVTFAGVRIEKNGRTIYDNNLEDCDYVGTELNTIISSVTIDKVGNIKTEKVVAHKFYGFDK